MFWLVQLLLPIGITVVLPVLIVWIVFRSVTNRDNKNAEIIIKAIESNSTMDIDKLVESLGRRRKTPVQIQQSRLLKGCIFSFIGIAIAIFAAITTFRIPIFPGKSTTMLISGIFLSIGLAYLIVYFVTKRSVSNTTADNNE